MEKEKEKGRVSAPDAVRLAEGAVAALLGIAATTRRDFRIASDDADLAKRACERAVRIHNEVVGLREDAPHLPLVQAERLLCAARVQANEEFARATSLRDAIHARLAREGLDLRAAREELLRAADEALDRARGATPPPPASSSLPPRPLPAAILRRAAEGVSRLGGAYTCPEVGDLLEQLALEIETGEPVARPT